MLQRDKATEATTRRRLARRYRTLGYDVHESPGPDRLPDFMQDTAPDIVARSASDNVVVEIKKRAALKGSNDIVGLANLVSGRADWRFELVVLEDERDEAVPSGTDDPSLLEQVHMATAARLFDMAFIYLVTVLVRTAHDLARNSGIPAGDRGDRALFLDLGFKGVLPDTLVERCLSALSLRNHLAHRHADPVDTSEAEVQGLLKLCEDVKGLL